MSKRQGDPQFKEIKKPKLNLYPSSQSLPSTDKNINGTATQSKHFLHFKDVLKLL